MVARRPRNTVVLIARNLSDWGHSFVEVNLSDGSVKTMLDESDAQYDQPVGDQHGEHLVFLRQSADLAPDFYLLGPKQGNRPIALSDYHDDVFPRLHVLGKAKLLTYKTANGTELHAAILLPPDYHPGSPVANGRLPVRQRVQITSYQPVWFGRGQWCNRKSPSGLQRVISQSSFLMRHTAALRRWRTT